MRGLFRYGADLTVVQADQAARIGLRQLEIFCRIAMNK